MSDEKKIPRAMPEIKQDRESLKENEILYKQLVDLSPDALIVHLNGEIVFINSAAILMVHAKDESDVIGKDIFEFIHHHSRQAVRDVIRLESNNEVSSRRIEEKIVCLDGKIIDAEILAAPLMWAGKQYGQIIVRDISIRKQIELTNNSESIIFSMLAGNDSLYAICNEICSLNEKLMQGCRCAVFRASDKGVAELIAAPSLGKSFFSELDALSGSERESICTYAIKSHEPVYVSNIRYDDRWEDFYILAEKYNVLSCWALPLYNRIHKVIGVLTYYFSHAAEPTPEDEQILNRFANLVTISIEKRKIEEELLRLSFVAKQTANAVYLLDMEFKVVWVNEGFIRLTGFLADEVMGKCPWDFLAGEKTDLDMTKNAMRKLAAGESMQYYNFNYKKNGAGYWVNSSIDVMRDLSGKHIGYLLWESDITEKIVKEKALIEAKQKAEAANQLKSSFLANMSHEIRTPMNGILGFADILREELANRQEDELYDLAETIYVSGKRLLNLINDILDLSRIEADKMELTFTECLVQESIQKIVSLLMPVAAKKGIEVIYNNKDTTEIFVDETRLFQVLNNIIGNAIKFTEKGSVKIKTYAVRKTSLSEVIIEITDTGSGIDPEFLPFVFDPFRQESSGFSRSHEGSGLGLAICRRLVQLMKGEISIESEKNVGTKVIVKFPSFVQEKRETPLSGDGLIDKDKLSLLQYKSPRVMLVEDDETSRSFFSYLLGKYVKMHMSANGEDCLKYTAECVEKGELPQLVLMDIGLPSPWNGIALRREIIRRHPEFENIPFIAQTAFAMKDEQKTLEKEGFSLSLTKPLSKIGLFNAIFRYTL